MAGTGHSWQSLAVDSSEEVLPDSDEDSVFSVMFVLLGDTGLESEELDEHDERLGDGEGDGEVCGSVIPLSEISCARAHYKDISYPVVVVLKWV